MAEELKAALFARRIVTVSGPLDTLLAGDTAAALMTLDALGDDPFELRIDSAQASLGAAFTVIDTIDVIGVPVFVTCVGTAGQGAAGVLAVGGRRRINAHGRVQLAEPHEQFSGRATEIEAAFAHHAQDLRRFQRRLAEASGQPFEHIEADMQANRILDAEAAVAYGLVDEIIGAPRR